MPIYEFKCRKCGHVFEFIKLQSEQVVECPKCQAKGERDLEKQISTGTSFDLKGDGWYRDRYQRDPSKK